MSKKKTKVLFVCRANVCRSPIAEAVFNDLLKKHNLEKEFEVDSAATTSWFAGEPPDQRALNIIKTHMLATTNIAREIENEDFTASDYIFGMDLGNIRDLKLSAPADCVSKIRLLGDFDTNGQRIIDDPFFDDDDSGYVKCYEQCVRCCNEFVRQYLNNQL